MVTVMSAFACLGLRWNALWHTSSSEELKTFQALGISACVAFGWPGFEVLFIHRRSKWCGISALRLESTSYEKQGIWEFMAGGRAGYATRTSLPLLQSKIHLFFFTDGWRCQLVSIFRTFLGWGILNVHHLKIGRLHGASNIQLWIERSSGFFTKEASTKCGGMTMFN